MGMRALVTDFTADTLYQISSDEETENVFLKALLISNTHYSMKINRLFYKRTGKIRNVFNKAKSFSESNHNAPICRTVGIKFRSIKVPIYLAKKSNQNDSL